jgi:ribosomal protein L7/L12
MSKHYKQALSLIPEMGKMFQAEHVCLLLAQEHPALFVKLATTKPISAETSERSRFDMLILELAQKQRFFGENRVAFIKWIREISGLGLKEAKDVADAVRDGYQVYVASFENYLKARDCEIIGLSPAFLMERVRYYTKNNSF